MSVTSTIVNNINSVILEPLFSFGLAAAVLVFIYGVVEFIVKSSKGEPDKDGKKHMLWGIVGIFVMVSAVSIIEVVLNTFGISSTPLENVPF